MGIWKSLILVCSLGIAVGCKPRQDQESAVKAQEGSALAGLPPLDQPVLLEVDQFQSWEAMKSAKLKVLAQHGQKGRIGGDWFHNFPHGFTGLPVMFLRILPDIDPEIFGRQEEFFSKYGFFMDNREPAKPLPRGFGWRPVPIDPTGASKATLNLSTLTCASCHVGRVRIKQNNFAYIDGGTNTAFNVRGWRVAFEKFAVKHLGFVDFEMKDGKPVPVIKDKKAMGAFLAKVTKAINSKPPGWFFRGYKGMTTEKEAIERQVMTSEKLLPQFVVGFKGKVLKRKQMLKGLIAAAYSKPNSMNFDGDFPGGTEAAGEAVATLVPPNMLNPQGAFVDYKAVFNQGWRPNSNWDGIIDEPLARTQTAQIATTGDPTKVDVQFSAIVTDWLTALPPPPYPFQVNFEAAKRGKKLFDANCLDCHRAPTNAEMSNSVTRQMDTGTDLNRWRLFNPATYKATIEVLRASCPKGSVTTTPRRGTVKPCEFSDSRILEPKLNPQNPQRNTNVGYNGHHLGGLWGTAPYLHNGSVPTLRHLLIPKERPVKFVRGLLSYDQRNIGFAWSASSLSRWKNIDRTAQVLDTRRDGMSNQGHDRNITANGKTYILDWSGRKDVDDLLEYLKTL